MNGMGDRQAKRLQSEQGDAVIHDDATIATAATAAAAAAAGASEEEKEKEKETETEQEKANANAKQCRRCGKNESILHPMKVEGEYQQLCSTCILQTNPGMYCALCLRMMQQNNNSDGGAGEGEVFKCAKCMRRMHIACLNSVAASGGQQQQQQQQQQEEEEEGEEEEEEASCALCRNPNCDPLQRQRQRRRDKVKVKVKAKASGKASALVEVEPYVVVLAARISAALLRRVAHSRAAEASNFAAEAVRKRNDAKDAINAAISNAISHQQHLMQQQQQILHQQALPRDPDKVNSETVSQNLGSSALGQIHNHSLPISNEPNVAVTPAR